MKQLLRQMMALVASGSLVLSGCVTTGSGSASDASSRVGPQSSSLFETKKIATVDPSKPRLEIVVPVFDPGLETPRRKAAPTSTFTDSPADALRDTTAETGGGSDETVWPDLRRAEANRFAWKLKQALEATGAFGAVRVTPDATATGDLYVLGRIAESNGEEVDIDIEVVDIAGNVWLADSFDHEVESAFHQNIRNKGKDPYDPVFDEAANAVALLLDRRSAEELAELQRITELRFGAYLTQEAFAGHLTEKDGHYTLASFPSESDPMLNRTRAIRVRDQLFVDGMQERYREFASRMDTSYLIWQEQSLAEIEAERKAEWEAAGKAALGVALIGLAVLAAVAGARSNSYGGQTAGATGAIVGATAGVSALSDSFHTSKEAKVHRDMLKELGKSIDIDLAPQVVEYEKETVELTGTAAEQFAQWRAFLKKIHEQERTPNVQL